MENKRINKGLLFVCIVLEFLVIIFLVRDACKKDIPIDIPMEQWTIQQDSPAYVSPFFLLEKGSYSIVVNYNQKGYERLYVYGGSDNKYNLEEVSVLIQPQRTNELIEFETTGRVDNAWIQFSRDNGDNTVLHEATLYRTHNQEKRIFVIALFIIICINIGYIIREWLYENRIAIAGVLLITFLASMPLFSYGHPTGHDLDFNLMRIDGIKQELLAGHFPVRMESIWNLEHGYPVAIYYGDYLLYIPAALRILGFKIIPAYKIYVFIINLLTSVTSFFVAKLIWKKQNIALLFSGAFVLSTYRFSDIYVSSRVGEYTSMLFFPLVFYGIYSLYYEEKSIGIDKTKIIDWDAFFSITFGMAGIITSHILTTEMVCIFLVVFVLVNIKKTISKQVIVTLISSAIATAFLAASFIVPFIDYYINVPVTINQRVEDGLRIQENGAYLTQYFAVFSSVVGAKSLVITERGAMTPGLALMSALALGILLLLKGVDNHNIKRLTISSVLVLLIASNLLPWNAISETRIGSILCQIQFPTRWLTFACVLLVVLLACILKYVDEEFSINYCRAIYSFFAAIIILQSVMNISDYTDNALEIKNISYTTQLSGWHLGEYLRTGSNYHEWTYVPTGKNVVSGKLVERSGSDYVFELTTTDYCEVTLPILNYKGYKVWDNDKNYYTINDGNQSQMVVNIPQNFNGKIYVSYIEPISWRVAEVVTVITAIVMLVSIILRRRKNWILTQIQSNNM